MKEKLEALQATALTELAAARSEEAVQEIRVRYLGRKGELTAIMKGAGALPPEERPLLGQVVNSVRDTLEGRIEEVLATVRAAAQAEKLRTERLDVTLPGRRRPLGTRHPITLVIEEVSEIFAGLG